MVLPTLLCACETWTVYQHHAKRLNHFYLSYLRKLLKIKWKDKIPDTEVLKKAGMQSMHTVLKIAQLRWTGHFIKMPDERFPKNVFYKRTTVGKALSRWSEETLQKHPLSIPEEFRHTNVVLETDCTGAIKVTRSHQQSIQVGNDQETAQSERNSHSKNRGGKTKLTIRYLY